MGQPNLCTWSLRCRGSEMQKAIVIQRARHWSGIPSPTILARKKQNTAERFCLLGQCEFPNRAW